MGGLNCFKKPTEEDIMNNFWNTLQLAKINHNQILTKIATFKTNSQEEFFRDIDLFLIQPNFKNDDYKTAVDYLKVNNLVIGSPFKALVILFCILLLSECGSDKAFCDSFVDLYNFCCKFMDLSNFNFNDKKFIKEIIIFYVHMVSVQTHKALINSKEASFFEPTKSEFNAIFSQKNRDEFIDKLFVNSYNSEKPDHFSLQAFMSNNFKRLHHDYVRTSLKDIEGKNISNGLKSLKQK